MCLKTVSVSSTYFDCPDLQACRAHPKELDRLHHIYLPIACPKGDLESEIVTEQTLTGYKRLPEYTRY